MASDENQPSQVPFYQGSRAGIHHNGCLCEMCQWAREVRDRQIERERAIQPLAPSFSAEWTAAPRERKRLVMQEDAEWWLMRGIWLGIQYERERAAAETNEDLREMVRVARERSG